MTAIERKVDRVRRALVAYGLETPGQVAVKDLTDFLGDLRHYCAILSGEISQPVNDPRLKSWAYESKPVDQDK